MRLWKRRLRVADFCDEFVTWVKTVSALTSLIGSGTAARIYPDQLKYGITSQAIVYEETGGDDVNYLGGLGGLCRTVIHTWCYGTTRTLANALDQALFVALCSTSTNITMGSTVATDRSRSNHRETGTDRKDDGSNDYRYWTHSVFDIWHAQATS